MCKEGDAFALKQDKHYRKLLLKNGFTDFAGILFCFGFFLFFSQRSCDNS